MYPAVGAALFAMVTHCATGMLDSPPPAENGVTPDAGEAGDDASSVDLTTEAGSDNDTGNNNDTGTSTHSGDAATAPDAVVTSCPTSWRSPTSSGTCHTSGCGGFLQPPCQPNGCFAGYWCDATSTPRCRATPPPGC